MKPRFNSSQIQALEAPPLSPTLRIPGGWKLAFRRGTIANPGINASRTYILEGYNSHGANCFQESMFSITKTDIHPSRTPLLELCVVFLTLSARDYVSSTHALVFADLRLHFAM